MSEIVITHIVKPSADAMLVAAELTAALHRLADAMSESGVRNAHLAEMDQLIGAVRANQHYVTPIPESPLSGPSALVSAKDSGASVRDLATKEIVAASAMLDKALEQKAPPPSQAVASAAPGVAKARSNPEAPKPAVAVILPPTTASRPDNWNPAWATPERRTALAKMYRANVRWPVIREELNRLPGPPLPALLTPIRMFVTEHLRVERDVPAPKRSAPIHHPSQATIRQNSDAFAKALRLPTQPIDVSTPIPVDLATARAKAATWGVEFNGWADLPALNEKARRIGHRPFAEEQRR